MAIPSWPPSTTFFFSFLIMTTRTARMSAKSSFLEEVSQCVSTKMDLLSLTFQLRNAEGCSKNSHIQVDWQLCQQKSIKIVYFCTSPTQSFFFQFQTPPPTIFPRTLRKRSWHTKLIFFVKMTLEKRLPVGRGRPLEDAGNFYFCAKQCNLMISLLQEQPPLGK